MVGDGWDGQAGVAWLDWVARMAGVGGRLVVVCWTPPGQKSVRRWPGSQYSSVGLAGPGSWATETRANTEGHMAKKAARGPMTARDQQRLRNAFAELPKGSLHKALGTQMGTRLSPGSLRGIAKKGSKKLAKRARLVLAIHHGGQKKKGKKGRG